MVSYPAWLHPQPLLHRIQSGSANKEGRFHHMFEMGRRLPLSPPVIRWETGLGGDQETTAAKTTARKGLNAHTETHLRWFSPFVLTKLQAAAFLWQNTLIHQPHRIFCPSYLHPGHFNGGTAFPLGPKQSVGYSIYAQISKNNIC